MMLLIPESDASGAIQSGSEAVESGCNGVLEGMAGATWAQGLAARIAHNGVRAEGKSQVGQSIGSSG